MKTNPFAYKFVEWSNPEELHQESLNWMLELEFIKDEQRFLNELIKNHTLQLISGEMYQSSLAVVNELSKEEKEVISLLKKIKRHTNKLEILVDGIDQLNEEKKYKEDHYMWKIETSTFLDNYKDTKKKIFSLIKQIMKQEKQKRLLN
jgi:hypothetical protein